MVSQYWQHILIAPTGLGLAAICLFAIPFTVWEVGQWRIVFLTKPLPWWVAPRVVAPFFLGVFLYFCTVALFAAMMTHYKVHSVATSGLYYVLESLIAVSLLSAAWMIVHRLLKTPFVLPTGGTFSDPNAPWTTAGDSDSGGSHHL